MLCCARCWHGARADRVLLCVFGSVLLLLLLILLTLLMLLKLMVNKLINMLAPEPSINQPPGAA